jgi:general secretion pathway protein I
MKKINWTLIKKKLFYSKKEQGFSMIEIMVALALFATIMGSSLGLISKSIEYRVKGQDLNKAVFLAQQQMNSIKIFNDEKSDQGEYESFPGFSYEFEIKEEEIDLMAMAESMLGEGASEMMDPSAMATVLGQKNNSGDKNLNSGPLFVMLHYRVTITYNEIQKYSIDYYKGIGLR